MLSSEIKDFVISQGADMCGIAPASRFARAPEGFKPTDIYSKCRSVVVFIKKMPGEIIVAENPIPYSHTGHLLYEALDRIALSLCGYLEKHNVKSVLVPCDTPYLHWEEEIDRGQAIISMRHAAWLA